MIALGRVLIRPTRWTNVVHRLLHWKRNEACLVCTAVWAYFVSLPGVQDQLDAGLADLKAGRLVRYEDVP